MVTRLVINLTQVYTPFFLLYVINCKPTAIAIIPCLIYLSSWLATFLAEWYVPTAHVPTAHVPTVPGTAIIFHINCLSVSFIL
jgi:hypothetical protein